MITCAHQKLNFPWSFSQAGSERADELPRADRGAANHCYITQRPRFLCGEVPSLTTTVQTYIAPREHYTKKINAKTAETVDERGLMPGKRSVHPPQLLLHFVVPFVSASQRQRQRNRVGQRIRCIPLGPVATMASKSGVWVFYYLQGEDGDSVENPNAFNVRESSPDGSGRRVLCACALLGVQRHSGRGKR